MSTYLWTQVWHLRLDKTSAFILMALCDSADDDGSRCFPSPQFIAWKTGMGLSTVYRTMENLQAKGILVEVDNGAPYAEYHIHLEKADLKEPWNKRRPGRPRKSVPEREEYSQSGKTFPTVGRIFPERETFSQSEKKFSQSGKDVHIQHRPSRQKKSGAKAGGVVADPYLIDPTYKTKPIEPGSIHHHSMEKTSEETPHVAPISHMPIVVPIAEVTKRERDTAPPPIAPPPSPSDGNIWRLIRSELEPAMSPPQRREYLDRCELLSAADDDYCVLCPTPFVAESMEARWGGHVRAALHKVTHRPDARLAFLSLGGVAK